MRQVDLDIRTAVGAPHCIVEATTAGHKRFTAGRR